MHDTAVLRGGQELGHQRIGPHMVGRLLQSESLLRDNFVKLFIYSEYMHLYTQFCWKRYVIGSTDRNAVLLTVEQRICTIQFITYIQFSTMLVSNQSIILFIHKFSKTCSDIILRKKNVMQLWVVTLYTFHGRQDTVESINDPGVRAKNMKVFSHAYLGDNQAKSIFGWTHPLKDGITKPRVLLACYPGHLGVGVSNCYVQHLGKSVTESEKL